jgi:transketolase
VRAAFIQTLAELAEADDRILFLTGDLGFMAVEPFIRRFPERFFNVGVAEQNLIGLATGLAETSYLPFAYSIVTFAALRPYEFVRNGPVLQRLPVRIVGIGAGFDYSHNGASHYGLDDIAVMRVQAGLTVISPADHQQTRSALLATWDLPSPIYYRLGKDDRLTIPGLDGRFRLGGIEVIREGRDVLLVAVGSIAGEAVKAADLLNARGIAATVAIVASFNPSPDDDLARLASQFPVTLTVEAHYAVGGLGSLVAEIIADRRLGTRVIRCGVGRVDDGITGSQDFLYERHGISGVGLATTAARALRGDSA